VSVVCSKLTVFRLWFVKLGINTIDTDFCRKKLMLCLFFRCKIVVSHQRIWLGTWDL